MDLDRSLRGALAGALAAAAWAGQQPLDKRLFGCGYDDVELLGKLLTRGRGWPLAGLALHLQNGAVFGAVYAQAAALVPGPPLLRGLAAGLAEHFGLWPLGRVIDRRHPARRDLPALSGNRRALAQATWRHAIFGALLGELEHRLNQPKAAPPAAIPVDSNGHGAIEQVATASR